MSKSTIVLTMEIAKLDGFNEEILIDILKKDLSELNAEIISYWPVNNGYRFKISYSVMIKELPYQAVLGCFTGIEEEYDKVKLNGILS